MRPVTSGTGDKGSGGFCQDGDGRQFKIVESKTNTDQAVHVQNNGDIDIVIHHREDAPVHKGLKDLLADLGVAAIVLVVINAGEGDDGNLVAEDVSDSVTFRRDGME